MPLAVQDYNCHKAGVVLVDQHKSYGSLDHQSVKWWRKLALHFIIMSVVNIYVLYKDTKGKGLSVTGLLKHATSGISRKKRNMEQKKGTSYTEKMQCVHRKITDSYRKSFYYLLLSTFYSILFQSLKNKSLYNIYSTDFFAIKTILTAKIRILRLY